jgi:Antibiotic biosynthesis monooxygenase
MTIWTHGVWTVKPGREDEFVAACPEMARDVLSQFEIAEAPRLLRDRERPNVYRSFGGWRDPETVERFRAHIRPRLADIEELTESIEILTLEEVPFDG